MSCMTWSVASSLGGATEAQSPMAYTRWSVPWPRTRSLLSVSSTLPFLGSCASCRRSIICNVSATASMPVDHTHMPKGSSIIWLLFLSRYSTDASFTSLTLAPVMRLMSMLRNWRSATSEMRRSYVLSMWSCDWIIDSDTCAVRSGNSVRTSSTSRSWNSPANSTPVGPPPTTTKCSMRSLSSLVSPGSDASSSRDSRRWRIFLACLISLRKYVCSLTPGVPKVLFLAPTATTRWS